MKKLLTLGTILAVSAFGFTACGKKDGGDAPRIHSSKSKLELPVEKTDLSVQEYVLSEKQLTILSTAIRAAGMRDDLQNQEKLTVFAPSNAAFGQIEGRKLQSLLTNKEALAPILQEHVLDYVYDTNDFKNENIKTMVGKTVQIEGKNMPTVNGAKIIRAVEAKNGYVYILDSVLGVQTENNEEEVKKN